MRDDTGIPRRTLLQGAAVLGATALRWRCGRRHAQGRLRRRRQSGRGAAGCRGRNLAGRHAVRVSGAHVELAVNCQQCVEACRKANGTPEDVPCRRASDAVHDGEWPEGVRFHLVHALRGSRLRDGVPCTGHHERRRRRGDGGPRPVHRLQVLLSGMSVRRAALHVCRHGQMRPVPRGWRCSGGGAQLRAGVQVPCAALRHDRRVGSRVGRTCKKIEASTGPSYVLL